MQLKNVLFPTDFSPCAEKAFEHALLFARESGATLHLFHLTILLADDPTNPAFHCRDVGQYERYARAATENAFNELLDRHKVRDLETVLVQRRGVSAGSEILDYVEQEKIDLVVMGTHGHRGLAKAMMGSQAAKVVQHAPCPVLTVCDKNAGPVTPERINKIVVPVDFSVPSERSLNLAGDIAARHGASIELLHVVEYYVLPGVYGTGPKAFADLVDQLDEKLCEMRDELHEVHGDHLPVNTHVIEARRASLGICTFARQSEANMIVIATEGLTGLPRYLIGGTTQRVVAGAPCPVFTVKAWDADTPAPDVDPELGI